MATTRSNGSLYTKISNGVATMVFAHPENNALGTELIGRLQQEFQKLSDDDTIKVILLTSEDDRAFCTGLSLGELVAIRNADEGLIFFTKLAQLYQAITSCKKIVIGRVQGKTTGESIGLLSACDYVFATEAASLQLPELTFGMSPILGTPMLVDKVGKAGFNELSLMPAGWKNAYWAKEKGLFAVIFDEIAEMDKEVDFFTTKLASYAIAALQETKKTFEITSKNWVGQLLERAEVLGKQVLSPHVQEIFSKIKRP